MPVMLIISFLPIEESINHIIFIFLVLLLMKKSHFSKSRTKVVKLLYLTKNLTKVFTLNIHTKEILKRKSLRILYSHKICKDFLQEHVKTRKFFLNTHKKLFLFTFLEESDKSTRPCYNSQ